METFTEKETIGKEHNCESKKYAEDLHIIGSSTSYDIVLASIKKISIGIILFLSLLFFFVMAVSEPIGDDVLNHFEGSNTAYLDEVPTELEERVTSLRQVLKAVTFSYQNWSGRAVGYFFMHSIALIPPLIRAGVMTLVCTANVLLALSLVYGKPRQVLYHPIAFVMLFLAMYWLKPDKSYA